MRTACYTNAGGRLAAAALLGLAAARAAPPGESPKRQPPLTCRVERRDIVEFCREDGILRAARTASLTPQPGTSDRLVAFHVGEGDDVKQGAPLYAFDTTLIDNNIRTREAQIESLVLRLQILRERRGAADLLEARLSLTRATGDLARVRATLGTAEELAELGLGSAHERDRLRSDAAAAELSVELAAQRLKEIETHPVSPEMAELEAQLVDHRNALHHLQEIRKASQGTAPFDGRVLMIHDTLKDFGAPSEDRPLRFFSAAKPLVMVADVRAVRVLGFFFESDIARIRPGQKATVTTASVPGAVFTGTVSRIGQLGSTHGQTSTLSIEVTVENTDYLLKPGLTAEIEVVVAEKKNVPAVPIEFIRRSEQGSYVWRLGPDGTSQRTGVQTGVSDGRAIEILSGVNEGDTLTME